jgi:aspartyl-tRNA synthetase
MSDPDMPTDDKYITFNRQDFLEWIATLPAYQEKIFTDVNALALPDAVVIRRQDKFASPCLLTYAVMISMVGKDHPDPRVRADLLDIADYFQRQGELAGDEGWKLPDL